MTRGFRPDYPLALLCEPPSDVVKVWPFGWSQAEALDLPINSRRGAPYGRPENVGSLGGVALSLSRTAEANFSGAVVSVGCAEESAEGVTALRASVFPALSKWMEGKTYE